MPSECRTRRHGSGAVATSVEAPWGPVHIAATARGIVAVELLTAMEAMSERLAARVGGPVVWVQSGGDAERAERADSMALANLRAGEASLTRALAGGDDDLGELVLDLEDRPAWDRLVLGAVRAIPRGEVRSYGEVARAIGRAGAARAVGGAVGRNPVGLLIPCHRVIAGDGTLGGYGGGWWGERDRLLDLKVELLAMEGRTVPRSPNRPGGAR